VNGDRRFVNVATIPIWLSGQKTWNLKERSLARSRLVLKEVSYGDHTFEQVAPDPKREDHFAIGVCLRPAISEVSVEGKRFDFSAPAGQSYFLYISGVDYIDMRSSRHSVGMSLPRAFMREIADDLELPHVTHIGNDACTLAYDPFLLRLAAMRPYFHSPASLDPLLADQVMWTFGLYVMSRYGDLKNRRPVAGGLTSWQERLSKELIETTLVGGTSLAELAQVCGVGVSQFAHAFKRSTGVSPYRWVVQRRVERAMDQLKAGQPLSEVALACGFVDQSHMTRMFKRATGVTPRAWRRLHQPRAFEDA
jgi:AraC-like DNA-binding protein